MAGTFPSYTLAINQEQLPRSKNFADRDFFASTHRWVLTKSLTPQKVGMPRQFLQIIYLPPRHGPFFVAVAGRQLQYLVKIQFLYYLSTVQNYDFRHVWLPSLFVPAVLPLPPLVPRC